VDSSASAYVTGETGSSDFPNTAVARQATFGCATFDMLVSKLNNPGSALVF
jgi:hypothetical protein